MHENGSSSLYADIIPGISDWFFNEELKPIYTSILGDSIVCSNELTQTYNLENGEGVYFDWKAVGGTLINPSTYSSQATVSWDIAAPLHSITVIAYNHLDAKGEEILLSIDLQQKDENTFLYINSDWSDSNNWSLAHSPIACEDVKLNSPPLLSDILLSTQAEINSLVIGNNIHLILNDDLSINQKTTLALYPSANLIGNLTNNSILTISNKGASKELIVQSSSVLTNNGDIHIKK